MIEMLHARRIHIQRRNSRIVRGARRDIAAYPRPSHFGGLDAGRESGVHSPSRVRPSEAAASVEGEVTIG
jgi:hypothetical protein